MLAVSASCEKAYAFEQMKSQKSLETPQLTRSELNYLPFYHTLLVITGLLLLVMPVSYWLLAVEIWIYMTERRIKKRSRLK